MLAANKSCQYSYNYESGRPFLYWQEGVAVLPSPICFVRGCGGCLALPYLYWQEGVAVWPAPICFVRGCGYKLSLLLLYVASYEDELLGCSNVLLPSGNSKLARQEDTGRKCNLMLIF